jgi:hypothetical protein
MFTGSASSGEGLEGVRRPDRDAKLDLIEYVTNHYPDRYFTFDWRQGRVRVLLDVGWGRNGGHGVIGGADRRQGHWQARDVTGAVGPLAR